MPMILPMHGLGGAADLPIPASLAIAGGTAALTLSFVVLLLAWTNPRFNTGHHERPVPARLARLLDSRGWAISLRALGMAFFAFLLWPALFGPDLVNNPVFGVVYVWLWVGIVPASLLFGRFFRAVSPARTFHLLLARATGIASHRDVKHYPTWLGYWPAAVGLFAFVWLELVSPDATYLGTVRLWFAGYLAAMIVGSALYGDRWLERADPFEVYSTLLAHLSVWSRDTQGRLIWTSPLRNLAKITPEPGLVAVVAVLLGSTAYDSWRESTTWVRFLQDSTVNATYLSTGMLPFAVTTVAGIFAVASMVTGTEGGERRHVPRQLAHSVMPIVVGYMVAHYLSYLVQVGQQTLIQLSDPMVSGQNLFGTAAGRSTTGWHNTPRCWPASRSSPSSPATSSASSPLTTERWRSYPQGTRSPVNCRCCSRWSSLHLHGPLPAVRSITMPIPQHPESPHPIDSELVLVMTDAVEIVGPFAVQAFVAVDVPVRAGS